MARSVAAKKRFYQAAYPTLELRRFLHCDAGGRRRRAPSKRGAQLARHADVTQSFIEPRACELIGGTLGTTYFDHRCRS